MGTWARLVARLQSLRRMIGTLEMDRAIANAARRSEDLRERARRDIEHEAWETDTWAKGKSTPSVRMAQRWRGATGSQVDVAMHACCVKDSDLGANVAAAYYSYACARTMRASYVFRRNASWHHA
eukprot:375938-Pleurochrysis_carterae.AAC.1